MRVTQHRGKCDGTNSGGEEYMRITQHVEKDAMFDIYSGRKECMRITQCIEKDAMFDTNSGGRQ